MKTSFDTLQFLEMPSNLIATVVSNGFVTQESIDGAMIEWQSFKIELECVWKPDNIKEYVVNKYRDDAKWYATKIKDLQARNYDERVKGISYRARMEINKNIDTLTRLFNETVKRGKVAKSKEYSIEDFVRPTDVPFIRHKGFEEHLRICLV